MLRQDKHVITNTCWSSQEGIRVDKLRVSYLLHYLILPNQSQGATIPSPIFFHMTLVHRRSPCTISSWWSLSIAWWMSFFSLSIPSTRVLHDSSRNSMTTMDHPPGSSSNPSNFGANPCSAHQLWTSLPYLRTNLTPIGWPWLVRPLMKKALSSLLYTFSTLRVQVYIVSSHTQPLSLLT